MANSITGALSVFPDHAGAVSALTGAMQHGSGIVGSGLVGLFADGAGLAVVNPAWMRFSAKLRSERFAQFAQRIFGLSNSGKDDLSLAMEGIDQFEDFLRSIGCPTRLPELGIGDALFSQYAEDAVLVVRDDDGNLHGRPPLGKADIVEVLRSAL